MRNFGCVMGDLYRVGIPMTFLTSDAEGDLTNAGARAILGALHTKNTTCVKVDLTGLCALARAAHNTQHDSRP